MLFLQYMVLRFWWYCTEMRNSRIVTTQLPTTQKALLQHFTAFTYSYTHTFTHWRAAMQKANPLIRSDNNKSSPAIFQCSADHTSTPTLMEKPSGAIRGPSRAAVARRETIYRGDDVNHQRPQRLNKKDSIYFVTGPLSGQPGVYLYHLKLLVFTQPSFSFWGGLKTSLWTLSLRPLTSDLLLSHISRTDDTSSPVEKNTVVISQTVPLTPQSRLSDSTLTRVPTSHCKDVTELYIRSLQSQD